MGGRYDFSYLRNGQLTLFVNRMLDRDAGIYEAVATNPFGEARQRIKLEVAEHPRFITRPEENIFITRKPGRLQCRITGYPECEVAIDFLLKSICHNSILLFGDRSNGTRIGFQ